MESFLKDNVHFCAFVSLNYTIYLIELYIHMELLETAEIPRSTSLASPVVTLYKAELSITVSTADWDHFHDLSVPPVHPATPLSSFSLHATLESWQPELFHIYHFIIS